jgi:hypothetical protein
MMTLSLEAAPTRPLSVVLALTGPIHDLTNRRHFHPRLAFR